jgi:hypothetical protein
MITLNYSEILKRQIAADERDFLHPSSGLEISKAGGWPILHKVKGCVGLFLFHDYYGMRELPAARDGMSSSN